MSSGARVLMLSQRRLMPLVSRCLSYEIEDVIRRVDAVDLVAPAYRQLGIQVVQPFALAQVLLNRLGQMTSAVRKVNPGICPARVEGRYDLFFTVCQFLTDLPAINALQGWRERSRIAACWIEEVWLRDIQRMRSQMAQLREFDFLFTSCWGSVESLALATGRPCAYVPPAVDCLRFFPGNPPPARVIDVFSMGRRHPDTHLALLEWSGREGRFYLHDTFCGNVPVDDPASHRAMLANLIKRARYFPANLAKATVSGETEGQEEVGFRFFEGAAGGAVMIGQPPDVPPFHEHFDWPDVLIRLPFGATEIAAILDELDAQPERLGRIRRDNVVNALLRHDAVYRWGFILDALGLERMPAVTERIGRLQALADALVWGEQPL
jgi:hypothetical protein